MAGTEDLSSRRQDDRADIAVAADFIQTANQFQHQTERERVAALRPIQGHDRSLPLSGHTDVLEIHGVFLNCTATRPSH